MGLTISDPVRLMLTKVDAVLQNVLELLQADEALPEKYRDYALVSHWVGHSDCHIKPDLVLI